MTGEDTKPLIDEYRQLAVCPVCGRGTTIQFARIYGLLHEPECRLYTKPDYTRFGPSY